MTICLDWILYALSLFFLPILISVLFEFECNSDKYMIFFGQLILIQIKQTVIYDDGQFSIKICYVYWDFTANINIEFWLFSAIKMWWFGSDLSQFYSFLFIFSAHKRWITVVDVSCKFGIGFLARLGLFIRAILLEINEKMVI